MDDLAKVEEIVLVAIWQLEDRAYGYNVRKHILNAPGNGNSDIYWVDANVIEKLKPDEFE